MDGTYNNPFAHNQSPLSPDTPTSASYQVNINRKKTRKWVEAKVQNYDGDDWGTDEYDEDDEPPPPPVPRVTTGLRPAGQRLPSESKPSARLVAAAAAGSARSASGPPSLRLQTQQSTTAPASSSSNQTPVSTTQPGPAASSMFPTNEQKTSTSSNSTPRSQGPVQDVISPVSARTNSPAPVGARFPPRKSSIGQQNAPETLPAGQLASAASSVRSGHSAAIPRTASPAGRSTPDRSSPLVRPSELYRQDRSSTNSPHPSVDSSLTKPSVRSVSPMEEPARPAPTDKEEEKTRLATQPTLDSIAERKSEYGLDKFPSSSQNAKPNDISDLKFDNKPLGDEMDEERKRMSVSPQLPDVARMSFFGPDLFASTSKDFSNAPPVPQAPVQESTKQEPPTTVAQPAPGTSSPPADRSHTSTPQSLPVSSVAPSSMEGPEPIKPESNPSSSVYNTRSGTPSDARSPVGSKPLSVITRTDSQRGGISPVSDQASEETANSATDTKNQKPNLQPTPDVHSVPPLRTPSPNAKGPVSTVFSHDDSARQSPSVAVSDLSSSSHAPTANITPTEPLRPRQADQSPIDFEPRPMQREPTISTVASSPVKESDVLSDEIMKSLSPVTSVPTLAPPIGNDSNSLAPGPRGDLRSSTYTLSGYDDYWADTTDKPDSKEAREDDDATPMPVPDPMKKSTEQPALALNTYEATTVTPNEPTQEPKSATETQDRRRFSWEASFDDKPKETSTQPPVTEDSSPKIPSIQSPSPVGQSDIQSPKDFVSDLTSPGSDSHKGTEPPSLVIPTSGGISHQVSKASTAHPSQQPAHMLEPPSPISVTSERHDPVPPDNRPVSLLQEDKQSSHTPTTPPPDDRPLSIPGYAPPPYQLRHEPAAPTRPLLAMRDIMNMQSSADRLAKYDETRQAYAAMDPGLQNWITAVKGQHPEHASATSNFNGGLPVSRQGLHTPTASGSHPPSQQPYYQQYLNASSPSVNAPGGSGQSRLGRLPGSSPGTSSTFGNSSNQIGSKSKEFMHSAGKMGKGLLSKGKSKLRGTGEKGEPIPPPTVHPKVKSERRTSWSLSLSSRSRTDGPATHSNKEMIVTNAPVQPPQLPQPAPVSPLESTSQINDPFQQHRPQDQDPRNIGDESDELAFVDSNHDDPHRWEIPTPVSKDNTPWDPFKDAKISNEDDSDVDEHSGVKLGDQDQPKVDTSEATASPRVSEEWVVVPEQNQPQQDVTQHTMSQQTIPQQTSLQQNQIRMVTPEPPSGPPHMTPTQGDVTPRAIVDPTKQRLMDEETPKRNSSFIGLPPIRRGSTFGLSNKPKPTSERFPIDDDNEDDRESSRVSEASTNEKGVDLNSIESSSIDSESITQQGVIPGQTAPTDGPLGQQQSFQVQMLQHQPQQMHSGGNGPFPPQPFPQQQPGQHPLQQLGQQQLVQQQPVASGALPLIPPHLMGDQQIKKPPSAGWSLQESQISVPLKDPVVRNRAGTGPSQQQHQKPFYGFDKETGLPNPPPSGPPAMAPTSPIKQQKRNADVPPSSTRRYPDLFSRPPPPGGPQQFSPNPNLPPGQQLPGQFSREGSFQRTGTGGQEAPGHEERGRSRASGIFKDIGSRFRRASTERRSSFADSRAGHGGPRPDDASEASIATDDPKERRKRRSSFLLGRQGRPSLDQARPGSDIGAPQPSPALQPENSSAGAPVHPQNERRSSLFGGGIGALTGRHHKGEHNGPPQSAASSIVNEPAPGSGKVPLKKRFSGFGAKAGVTGVFHRSSQDPIQKPGTPHSLRSEISAPPPGPPQQQGPPQQFGPPQKQGPPQHSPPLQGPPHQNQGPPQQGPPQQGPPRQYGPPQLHGPPQKQGPPQQGPPQQGLLQQTPPQHGPPRQYGPPQLYGPPQQQGPPQQYGPPQKPGPPQFGPPQQGPLPQGPPNAMHPPLVPPHATFNNAAGPAPYGPINVADSAPPEKEKRKRRGSAAGLISGLLGHKSRDKSPATPPEGRQPMLRRMTGSSSLLDLDSSANTSQDRPASGNRPSPELTRSTTDPTLGSVSPGKQPPQLLSQQSRPSPLRQGTPVMQDEPFQAPPQQTNSPRAPSTPRQPIQPNSPRAPTSPVAAHQNSPRSPPHVSPIVTGSPRNYPKPPFTGSPRLGSPRLASESENAPPGSPRGQRIPPSTSSPRIDADSPSILSNAAPAISGNDRGRVVSSPPGDPAARPGRISPTPGENARQSLDSSVQLSTDPREHQKVGGFSPDFSRKPGLPSEASQATSVNQDFPQSPVSQISKAEIPSVASSVKGQSPRLGTSVPNMSEQFVRNQSQPGTPSLSQASQTPPTQHQRQLEEHRQTQQHPPPQQQQRQSQQLPRQLPPPQQQQEQQEQQEQQQPLSGRPRQESFGTVMAGHQQQQQQQQRPQSIQQRPPSGYQIAPGTQQPPGLPIPHSTVQPFPNQSSQTSPRPSLQMSNSMPPQNFVRNTMPPPGQPQPQPPVNGPPRTDSPGSKWTGLRNRISSQASNLGSQPPPQGKHGGEGKSSTSKLLSAFKRSSKQPEPRQHGQIHPMNMQGPPGGQPFPQGPPRMQQPQAQQQFMQQQRPNQQQHPQQQRPMQQSPPPHAQVQQRQSSPMHSPVTGQQPFSQPPRSNSNAFGLPPPPSQGQSMNGPRPIIQDPLRQQKPAPQRSQEPQYDQVPIPRGYQAVRGEGMSIPSQYNVGRPMYQAYQQQPMNMAQFPPQQFQPQQLQPQQMNAGMLRQVSSPQVLQQQQQMMAPPAMDRRSTDMPGARGPEGQLGQISPPLRGTSFEVNQQTRPDAPRVASEDSQQNNRMNMGPRSVSSPLQNLGPVSQNNQTGPAPRHADPLRSHPSKQNLVAPQPAPQIDSSRAQSNASSPAAPPAAPRQQEQPKEQQPRESGVMLFQSDSPPKLDQPHPTSPSPPVEQTRAVSPNTNLKTQSTTPPGEPATNLDVAVDKDRSPSPASPPIESTEFIKPHRGLSQEEFFTPAQERDELIPPVRSPAQEEDAHAELEDTQEAHKRKLRIDSQEEKIHYDPNADSDGEVPPQMSATSYPGQEWNPYGMPEFGEWQE